ncbi:MAG TPA: hypothetical protein VF414_15800 [Thermoanaerobaculia bacterium]
MPAVPAMPPPRRQGLAVGILGFVLLAVLHVALAAPMRAPMIFGDETANLGIARFLAGRPPFPLLAHPTEAWAPYYRFGYPLLVMPAWRLTGDPLTVYRAALVLNGLLLAALFPLLAAFARRVLDLPRRDAALAGFAASLYPAFLLQSNLTWSESLVIPLVTGILLAFHRLAAKPGTGAACAFGLLSVFAYAVHERTLGLVPLALLAIAVLWRRGRLSGRAVAVSWAAMLAAFAAVRAIDAVIFVRLWGSSSRRYGVGDIAGNLADPEVLAALGKVGLSLTGQLWYLTVASLGLFPLGVWVLVRTARQAEAPERRLTALFALAAAAVLIGTSSVFLLRLLRADIAIYGRYSEAFLAPFLVAGLAGLHGGLRRLPAALGTAALAGVLAEVLILGHPPEVWQLVHQQMNLLGIMPAVLLLGGLRLLRITALGMGAALLVQAVGAFRPRASAVLAGALFLAGAVWFHRSWTVPTNNTGFQARSIPDAVHALKAPEVAYDLAGATHDEYFAYQFRLGDARMVLFDHRREPAPRELVISKKFFGDSQPGARLVFPERYIDQALWAVPGALQDRLGREGRLFPADWGAPLPPAALRSELAWIEPPAEPLRLGPGEAQRLPLRVTHRGHGGDAAPWLPFDARQDPRGAVRIAMRWLGGDGAVLLDQRTELPRAVAPGETVEAVVELRATLPPGRYLVRIGMVQELVGWFDAAGDRSLDLAVEVR